MIRMDFISLFGQLIEFGFRQSAVGLLSDLFDRLARVDRDASEPIERARQLPGDGDDNIAAWLESAVQEIRATLREKLMLLLEDSDGEVLVILRQLHQYDRQAFRAAALSRVESLQRYHAARRQRQ